LRLKREASGSGECILVADAAGAAAEVARRTGRVLLTTGVKDLAAFTVVPEYRQRLFLRVLPAPASLRECARLGFRSSHVIAMQGPFSRELNRAILTNFAIHLLVTKDGGSAGGFQEKLLAAADAGVEVVVIGRPPERDGYPFDALLAVLVRALEGRS
ncbi:MAG: precorrin-6A/cobalt-precorrin-6A reductase, partial [Planctomycetes bacterium]|nr:precorrin-6A/cobalt-precorrin-6A reductase [Planctomycetota bacterium]